MRMGVFISLIGIATNFDRLLENALRERGVELLRAAGVVHF